MRTALLMMVNAATHYASLAMLDLAMHGDAAHPVRTADIIARNDIPGPFLTQILRTLKTAGWVTATRGAQGGYALRVHADAITLLDIAEAIGSLEPATESAVNGSPAQQAVRSCWQKAGDSGRRELARVRLGDLVRQCAGREAEMFYI